jgi:hypothetical protein
MKSVKSKFFLVFKYFKKNSWEKIIDFTEIKKGGVKIQDILSRL